MSRLLIGSALGAAVAAAAFSAADWGPGPSNADRERAARKKAPPPTDPVPETRQMRRARERREAKKADQ